MTMLNQQNDDFLNRYIVTILQRGRILKENGEFLFLPYAGKDENTIIRLFKKFIEIKYPTYNIDDDILNVLRYLTKIHTKEAEKPGLILWGPTGSGKTLLLHLWFAFRVKILSNPSIESNFVNNRLNNRILESIVNSDMFNIIHLTPESLISNFTSNPDKFFINYAGSRYPILKGNVLFIDDMGVKDSVIHFGNKVEVLQDLIYARYNIFKQDSSFEFYGTTNWKTEDELKEGIKERAYSRLCEMAEWEEGWLSRKDRRREKNYLKEWPKIENRVNLNLW